MFLGITWLEWYFSITIAYFITKILVGGQSEMNLKLQMPEEFAEELNKNIQLVYEEAIETARRDVGVIREYLNIQEVCKMLGISRNTLTNNYFEKGLPKYKIESKIFVKKTELNDFISKHQI